MTISAPPVGTVYGTSWTATVQISGGDDGLIEIRRGTSTVMASGSTSGGTAQIVISGTTWVAGSYPIRAAYVGAGSTGPASSDPQTATVAKANAVVTTTLASTVRTTTHASLHVTVSVVGDPNPYGTLKVYDGSHRIVTTTLSSTAGGKKTISLPYFTKGTHSIQVVYSGNSNINAKNSIHRHITAY